MVAKTDQERLELLKRIHNAMLGLWVDGQDRLLSLTASMLELTGDGKRGLEEVCVVLQAIKDGKKFRKESDVTAGQTSADVDSQLVSWQDLYLEHGIKVDIANLKIPAPQPGFTRLILVPEGLTPNKAVALLRKKMRVWKYTDNLDTITSVRDTKKTYVIWVRDRVEADEELQNKSADDLKRDGVNCVTLIERLLYELKFFTETGKHLDEKNWTLCAGSRDPDGSVPCVIWFPDCGKVRVRWFCAGDRYGSLRSRAVVS